MIIIVTTTTATTIIILILSMFPEKTSQKLWESEWFILTAGMGVGAWRKVYLSLTSKRARISTSKAGVKSIPGCEPEGHKETHKAVKIHGGWDGSWSWRWRIASEPIEEFELCSVHNEEAFSDFSAEEWHSLFGIFKRSFWQTCSS